MSASPDASASVMPSAPAFWTYWTSMNPSAFSSSPATYCGA
jgi:hypothetical protein